MRLSAWRLLLLTAVVCSALGASARGQGSSSAPPSAPETQTPAQGAGDSAQTAAAAGVTKPPKVLSMANPSYTDAARKKKLSGDVLLSLIVDQNGLPQDVQVTKGLGSGLDEKAVEAVRQYRFRPAMRNGVAVPTKLLIKVNFKIF